MDDAALIATGAVTLVNVFTPKPGMTDAFVTAQTAEYVRLKGRVEGALGNRLLKSLDGKRAVNIAYFASVPLYDAWRASALFEDHLGRIKHLVDGVDPDLYRPVYESDEAAAAARDPALDRLDILQLSNVFENAFDDGDLDAHMATWAPTLTYRSPFGDFDDPAAYRAWVAGFSAQMQARGGTRHLISNSVLAIDGERATQTCYLTILLRTDRSVAGTAAFQDVLTRTPDGWRFVQRTLTVDQDMTHQSGSGQVASA